MSLTLSLPSPVRDGKTVALPPSITLESGKVLVVQGESGCGKTTLLNCLAGCGGMERVLPEDLRVAYMFQEDRLFGALTARKNAALVSRETADELFARVGIDPDTRVSEMSGGMRRRVALVRALAYGGDVLLFDEPTAGLDPVTSDKVFALIKEHAAGRYCVVVTHDASAAGKLGATVLTLG